MCEKLFISDNKKELEKFLDEELLPEVNKTTPAEGDDNNNEFL